MAENEKKKVLFLLEAFDKGGIEKVTLDIVNALDPKQYDITVQTFWYGGHCQSQVKEHIKVLPFFFRRYVRGVIRLIAYLPPKMLHFIFVRKKYDIEIAASDGGAAKVISGSTNKRSKKICWVHMDVMQRGSKLKEFKNAGTARKIYHKFDVIAPVSEACAQRFREKFGNEYPITVVRNPIPTHEILKKANAVSLMRSERLEFVSVGRLVEEKGFDRLLHAVCAAKDESRTPFHITIIGEGPERKKLETLIAANELNELVTLMGFLDNPYPYIKNADAFLLSSRDEAFSLVVGESLLLGTPVLATDCSGIAEWLQGAKYGAVLQNTTEGITTGLLRALQEPEILISYRKRLSQAQELLSFEKDLAEFEALLR